MHFKLLLACRYFEYTLNCSQFIAFVLNNPVKLKITHLTQVKGLALYLKESEADQMNRIK